MKFVYIADIHLSRYSQDKIEDESNLPERLHSIRRALIEVAEYCIANDIDHIIIGGDTLHGKSVIYAIAQELMLDYFNDYQNIQFIVIDGNHDLSGKGKRVVSALRPLKNVPNVDWIRFDTTLFWESEDILFVPYSYDLAQVIKKNKAKILISHFGLSEGMLNSGMSIISDVSIKDLTGRYECVLLGHYHRPQEIIRPDISIYYVGSLIQLDWGEKGDEKRFLVVDSKTMEIQSIPITQYKQHIEIELLSSNVDEALQAAREAKKAGHHVNVIMKEAVDLTSVKGEFRVVDKTETDITDRGITSSMSQEDKCRKYLDIKQIPEDKREAYLQLAKEIIDEVESV